jgi:hypothetical protein
MGEVDVNEVGTTSTAESDVEPKPAKIPRKENGS